MQATPRPFARVFAFALICGFALASCNSSSPSDSGAGNGGGHASAIKACNLLTLDEIKQATGAAMGAGHLQTTDTQASCDWSALDETAGAAGVGVVVQDFDGALWQTMSSAQPAVAVHGIGEQAFKGYPHKGDLSVKQGRYQVEVGIVDFKHDVATTDAAALKIMNLVLSRL